MANIKPAELRTGKTGKDEVSKRKQVENKLNAYINMLTEKDMSREPANRRALGFFI